MNVVFLFSVILKGLGAVLEILLQMLITGAIGVSGYGTYSTWINAADLLFWIFFSGLVKCNTFYLSGQDTSIRSFKRKYYAAYAIPLLAVAALGTILLGGSPTLCFVFAITGLELQVLDRSSTLLAQGQSVVSLVGEYVLGRLILVAGVLVLRQQERLNSQTLLVLYVAQYLLVILFFLLRRKKGNGARKDISGQVNLKKWGAYQQADLMHAMVEQMPVVLQYFFAGAFEAGVVSVVLLVKKLINFISGPTAKVFLPEFSRLYHAGEKQKIRDCYASIMRIQMLIVGPLAVVLLGYPRVILRILARELEDYALLFVVCSVVFLLVSSLGPCGGILQMTGNEKMDNRCRQAALLGMLVIMVLARKDPYFVLYGLCGQVALESAGKYAFVCKWMERPPVKLTVYLKWWLIPAAAICAACLLGLQNSFGAMVLTAGAVFAAGLLQELRNEENGFLSRLKKKKE